MTFSAGGRVGVEEDTKTYSQAGAKKGVIYYFQITFVGCDFIKRAEKKFQKGDESACIRKQAFLACLFPARDPTHEQQYS